jgi:hypothetical protein
MDVAAVEARFAEVALHRPLVQQHQFDRGHDKVEYLNFTFGTDDLEGLWRYIWEALFRDQQFRGPMEVASIVTCEGEHGWDDYLLLYHFDPAVKRDAL